MPGMDGLTAIEHLQRDYPDVAVVILTTFNEDELMLRGLQAGARGFLLKDTPRETLLDTIQAAARAETLLQPDIMNRLLAHTQAKTTNVEGKTAVSSDPIHPLNRPRIRSPASRRRWRNQQRHRLAARHLRPHRQSPSHQRLQ